MKKILISSFIGFLFCICTFGQDAEKILEVKNTPCDQYLAEMDSMVIISNKNPTAKIYVLVYEGRKRVFNYKNNAYEVLYPIKGTAEAQIKSIKEYHSLRKYSGENFVFIKAGFQENPTVEFWLVPDGAEPPKPESAVEEMPYRKGKAYGFCTDCC